MCDATDIAKLRQPQTVNIGYHLPHEEQNVAFFCFSM